MNESLIERIKSQIMALDLTNPSVEDLLEAAALFAALKAAKAVGNSLNFGDA